MLEIHNADRTTTQLATVNVNVAKAEKICRMAYGEIKEDGSPSFLSAVIIDDQPRIICFRLDVQRLPITAEETLSMYSPNV